MIIVIQPDIDYGVRHEMVHNPITHAIGRTYPNSYIKADQSHISMDGIEFHCPDSVISFIDDFDNGKSVKPFSFELQEIT